MRQSSLFGRTLREAPAEAQTAGHRLLLRAAFVRKLMAGIYTWMPLGWRTLRKIEAIVREEMDGAGAQELRMPIVVPAEPWRLTGRWQAYGEEMFKLRFQFATRQLTNTARIRTVRRDIARMRTMLRQRELANA